MFFFFHFTQFWFLYLQIVCLFKSGLYFLHTYSLLKTHNPVPSFLGPLPFLFLYAAGCLPSRSCLQSRFSPLGRLAAAGQSNAKAIPGAQERLSECSLSSSQKARKTTRRREKVQVPMARFLTPAIPGSVLFVRSSGSLFNYHGTLTSQVHGLQEEVIPRHCQPAGQSKVVSGGLWPC